jgi:hypothetical protein
MENKPRLSGLEWEGTAWALGKLATPHKMNRMAKIAGMAHNTKRPTRRRLDLEKPGTGFLFSILTSRQTVPLLIQGKSY